MADIEPDKNSRSFWIVVERATEDGLSDIDFRVERPGCPASQLALKNEVEKALSTINALYAHPTDTRKRAESFAKLIALARVGLVGPNASPDIATNALRALEADIVGREAGPVKNAYMRKLGIWAAAFAIVALMGFFVCDMFPSVPVKQVVNYRMFFVLTAGCMVGTWVSFASRRVNLGFHDLVALEEDRVEPALRLLFSSTLTVILGLVFSSGMANVEIGNFSASLLTTSGSIAFLTGAFAGISEKALPSAILARASEILPQQSR